MKEVTRAGGRFVRAVEAHNVVILFFYPNLATKAAMASPFLREYVEEYAADIPQELVARVLEIVGLAIELVAISIDHPRETQWFVSERKQTGEATQQAALEAGAFVDIVMAGHVAQVHAAEEVMVSHRDRTFLRTELQVLQIGFNKRGVGLQHFYQRMLSFQRAIHDRVHVVGGTRCWHDTGGCCWEARQDLRRLGIELSDRHTWCGRSVRRW